MPRSPVVVVLFASSFAHSVSAAEAETEPERRKLNFSGYVWWVKSSEGRVGPGPNYFSDSTNHVWLDAQGRLHLRIAQREDGKWRCAEVVNEASLGLGRYRFEVDSCLDSLDPHVVLGLFTWSDERAFSHREIDFEYSKWSKSTNRFNAQFVVQPYARSGHIERFTLPEGLLATGHSFVWSEQEVAFRSIRGHNWGDTNASQIVHEWKFTKKAVPAGGENVRMNLWLNNGSGQRYHGHHQEV